MMDDIFVWVFSNFWLFIILIIILSLVFSFRRYKKIKDIMQNLALKRNGTVEGYFFHPVLVFPYHDLSVRVSSRQGSKNSPPETRVHTTLNNNLPSKVVIYKESIVSGLGKLVGMQDIQIGSDEFDKEFIIRGDDEQFVINLINYGIQNKLLGIKKEKPHVSIVGNSLDVYVQIFLKNEESYDQLIDIALAFVDRIKELKSI